MSQTGLTPTATSYAAIVYTAVGLQGVYAGIVTFMAFYTLARAQAGLVNSTRRVTFDNTMLLWHYTVAQGLAGLLLVHAFPRWVA